MTKDQKKLTLFASIGALIIVVVGGFIWYESTPGQYDASAQCIADSGATFYGAFWCPHCQEQKRMFGRAAELLPYEECSTPDGQGQLEVCEEAGIESYPTWEFTDGSQLSGVVPMEELASKTGCELPE